MPPLTRAVLQRERDPAARGGATGLDLVGGWFNFDFDLGGHHLPLAPLVPPLLIPLRAALLLPHLPPARLAVLPSTRKTQLGGG
jgi:hypothetical protein